MSYQSKHTGANIDAGIDINDTQNNRLTALESKDTILQNNIDAVNSNLNTNITAFNSTIINLQSQISSLQSQITSLQQELGLKVNIDQAFLGYSQTAIPSNANLNNYKTVGSYCCSGSASAATLSNCPCSEAFTMFVYNAVGGGQPIPPTSSGKYVYIRQVVIPFSSTKIYMRMISYNGSTTPVYGSWNAI